jgi:hypothetical protein
VRLTLRAYRFLSILPTLGLMGASALTSPVCAQRVALVIGNASYAAAPRLANPLTDARLIEGALRAGGFTRIDVRSDLSKAAFDNALRSFRAVADQSDVALIYYAGHGLELNGRNWLVPIDATLADERDLPFQAVDLDTVLATVASARGLRVVILDACRDNPFTRSIQRMSGVRGLGTRGLSAVDISGTLVLYAQRAGETALDSTEGTGQDSPFATALAKRLPEPGVDIRLLVSQVRDDVLAMTGRRQEPFSYGSLPGIPLMLVPGGAPVTAAAITTSIGGRAGGDRAGRGSETAQVPTVSGPPDQPESARTADVFEMTSDGLLRDRRSGLQWTPRDMGADTGWHEAKEYCATLHMRLPTVREMQTIYGGENEAGVPCGDDLFPCKVPKQFKLSGDPFWTGDTRGLIGFDAIQFSLQRGDTYPQSLGTQRRVLCVRASPGR